MIAEFQRSSQNLLKAAARSVARQVFIRMGATDLPPMDVERIANAAAGAVVRLVEDPTILDGALEPFGGEWVIRLNPKKSQARKRFTLCHEVGHIILKTTSLWRVLTRYPHEMQEMLEERLCDLIAVELLIPPIHLSKLAKELDPGYQSIKRLADSFQASTQSMEIQISETGIWNCLFVRFFPKRSTGGELQFRVERVDGFCRTQHCDIRTLFRRGNVFGMPYLLQAFHGGTIGSQPWDTRCACGKPLTLIMDSQMRVRENARTLSAIVGYTRTTSKRINTLEPA